MSKILVLGSTSFAGASFIDYILNNGHTAIGISRSMEPDNLTLAYGKNPARENRFIFHKLDLNKDLDRIIDIILQEQPEFVADFAGQGMVAQSWNWPEQWYQTNVVSKVKLHNALKNSTFLKSYVRISTPEVYGDCQNLISENNVYNPSTPYAVSHAAIDMSLASFFRQYNFPVIFTRFANFFGPYQQLYRIIPKTIISALTLDTLYLEGGGKSVRAFIHGNDVAEGIWKSISSGKPGETYHFSTSEFVKICDLVSMISKRLGVPMDKFVRLSAERPGQDQAYLMNSQKARQELGWHPKYNLEDGIEETVNWIADNIDAIKKLPQKYTHKI